MAKNIAKSKGNHSRRANQRNNGLPSGIRRAGSVNVLDSASKMLSSAPKLSELKRRLKLLRRWGVRASLANG